MKKIKSRYIVCFFILILGYGGYLIGKQFVFSEAIKNSQRNAVRVINKTVRRNSDSRNDIENKEVNILDRWIISKEQSSLKVADSKEKSLKGAKKVYQNPSYDGSGVETLSPTNIHDVDVESLVFDYGIGILEIPDLNINLVILEGVSSDNLMIGVGTMKPNQRIGSGNYALAGHNMLDNRILLSNIRNASKGMKIYLRSATKTIKYKITDVRIIPITFTQVISDEEGDGIISLITCNDSGSARLLVRGIIDKEV